MKTLGKILAFSSCVIVAAVFWLALIGFSNVRFFNNTNVTTTTNLDDKFDEYCLQQYVKYGKHTINSSHNRGIILRIDDVQAYQRISRRDVTIKMVNEILSRNMSVVLGVIPSPEIKDDMITRNFLVGISNNSNVEIAQHGYLHTENEFMNESYSDARTQIDAGYNNIIKYLHVYPITFIPPYNVYNDDTEQALIDEGFTILSSGRNESSFGNITKLGFDEETKVTGNDDLVPVSEILKGCNKSLSEKNICVIMIHPQDYAGNRTINESKFKKFEELLDGINTLVNTTTFKSL